MVITAFALFGLISMLTFAIDIPHWFDYSRNLQNRADAAALAAGDQFGAICGSNPTDGRTSPELPIGQMAQLFSGPPGPSSDLPYPYSGTGSPLTAFPQFSGYQNIPNLSVSNGSKGANYHVILNGDNYATKGGTSFAIGDFCHGNPTLDKTDKECFGQTHLTGQLALDCATGAMVDVKVTQGHLPPLIPIFNFRPNIGAHARVTIQGIGSSNNLKPLGVRDPGVIPCIQLKLIPFGGTGTAPPTQTVQLTVDKALTGSTGPVIWDNSNGGTGSSISVPSGWNLYEQAILYAQGASGDCTTMSNPLTYEASSGIQILNSYGTTLPTSTQAPKLIGSRSAGDGASVFTVNPTCSPNQYFSNNTASCSVKVCAIVAFTPGSTQHDVTVATPSVGGGNPRDMNLAVGDPNCSTTITGAEAWESNAITIAPTSGQSQFTLGWKEHASGVCSGNCTGSFGLEQQAFSACNENFNSACAAPNQSGPIVASNVTEINGLASTLNVGSLKAGSHNLIFTLDIQGLQDSPRSDRCANGPTQCTLLRVDQGNADGMVDCGEGNGASAARDTVLYGCPLYGQTATTANPSVCNNNPYCGGWMVTPDGSCNNATRTATSNVDCVNSNNNGATMPACIQALVVAGASGSVDYSQINPQNCHVNGSTCSEDKWLDGGVIDPSQVSDPRIITAFILFQGDIAGINGQHDLPIRTFASFYVTGWQVKSNGQQVNCTGLGANEPAPSNLPNNADAIWGHWITYTEVGAGGNGQPCNFQAFGDCAAVLTR